MNHTKLIVFGVVLVAVVVFAFAFWDDFSWNRDEIANTPLPPSTEQQQNPAINQEKNAKLESQAEKQPALSQGDSYDDLNKDLEETDLNVTSDDAQMSSEMSGL